MNVGIVGMGLNSSWTQKLQELIAIYSDGLCFFFFCGPKAALTLQIYVCSQPTTSNSQKHNKQTSKQHKPLPSTISV